MTKYQQNFSDEELKSLLDLIKYPVITEKSTKDVSYPFYTFLVVKEAKKPEIKKAIELAFNVTIEKINTLRLPRKKRRFGKNYGFKSQYKKVIIRLKKDNKIDFYNLIKEEKK